MTDVQKKDLTNFETRVRQLMLRYESLRKEHEILMQRLDVSESELKDAKETIRSTSTKYENLKLAKMLSHGEKDVKSAQQRVSKLVREIDKCIALINE